MLLRMTSSTLALLALAAPALAAVTPDQVWQDWLGYFEATGYTVTEGSREAAGATLTLRDVSFEAKSGDSNVSFTIPELTMQETGDGAVRSTYADQQDVKIAGTDPDGDIFDLTLHLSYPGNEMISSGEPGNITHAYNYPELTIAVQTLTTDDKTMELPITVNLVGSTGTLQGLGSADAPQWTARHKTENITVTAAVDQPEAKVDLDAKMAGLEFNAAQTGGMKGNDGDFPAALKAGFAGEGNFTLGATEAQFTVIDRSDEDDISEVRGTIGLGPTDAVYQISRDGLGYQLNYSDLDVELQAQPLPFPIRYGLESVNLDLQMPLMETELAQPFKLAFSLAGLKLGDQIWDMFDPAKTLNRDPANIDLDVTGQTRLTRDLLDTRALEGDDPMSIGADNNPFDLVELTLNQFGLKAVGATVAATGEMRPSEEHGMDQPTGNLKVNFSGVAELIQVLAQMGLLPPEQVMAANAMIGMFTTEDPANPGGRAAELVMNEDGSVFANGVQLQ